MSGRGCAPETLQPRYGRLTVIGQSLRRRNGRMQIECRCDCGKHVTVPRQRLRSGDTKSCGCLRAENLGSNRAPMEPRYGRLTVVRHAGSDHRGRAMYACECVCGSKVTLPGESLRGKRTRSCGCLRAEVSAELCRRRAAERRAAKQQEAA